MTSRITSGSGSRRFVKNCTVLQGSRRLLVSVELVRDTDRKQDATIGGEFPRIIHRTWKTVDVPARWADGASSCRDVNPDHHYCHWTDDELEKFIGVEYGWFLPTYRRYTYNIQRVDAARYFLLYHYGGVYIDLDLVCRRPFVEILAGKAVSTSSSLSKNDDDNDDVVFVETLPVGVTNEFLAVRRAGDPFMRDVFNGLMSNADTYYFFPYPTIMFSTGPMYLSHQLWHMQETAAKTATGNGNGNRNGTRARIIERRLFEREYFQHLVGSSWHRWDGMIIWTFFRFRYAFLAAGVVLVVCIVFAVIHRQRFNVRKRRRPCDCRHC
jgi:mannosyltransferase OCH1-like enzyme